MQSGAATKKQFAERYLWDDTIYVPSFKTCKNNYIYFEHMYMWQKYTNFHDNDKPEILGRGYLWEERRLMTLGRHHRECQLNLQCFISQTVS